MSKHLKRFSYKQMWNFTYKSRSLQKQKYWMNRIYTKKIKEAEKTQEYTRAEYLKTLKSNLEPRIKIARRFGGIGRRQDWKVATDKDIIDMALYGKETKKHLLIPDDNNKIIVYEGTKLYDEIMEAKLKLSKKFGVKDITKALEKKK